MIRLSRFYPVWFVLLLCISLVNVHVRSQSVDGTAEPTYPTDVTEAPTEAPTTTAPTDTPTGTPTDTPTIYPTDIPTTETPTTETPTIYPSDIPTTETPTIYPSDIPTTETPTIHPSDGPTIFPTTSAPTSFPSPGPNPTQCPTYSPEYTVHPTLPPAGGVPYTRANYTTASYNNATYHRNHTLRTFSEHLDLFILTQPQAYAQFVNEARARYQQTGYWIDPRKVPADSYPSPTPGCYSCVYYPNNYSIFGYDQHGYDPQGYNEAGYGRDGYSRYGRETNSSYNQLCQFAYPEYANQTCIFDNFGKPYTTQDGEILRYDQHGYDQYGNDQYGNPKPVACNSTNPAQPPPQNPVSNTSLTETDLRCEVLSEEKQPNGTIIYLRKAAHTFTVEDWRHFRQAWRTINDQGIIEEMRLIHTGNFQQHRNLHFAPWHREFVARLEDYLHRVDPCVFLPYWDIVAQRSLPAGIGIGVEPNFPPDVKTVAEDGTVLSTAQVTRGPMTGILPNAGIVAAALTPTDFPTHSQRLESLHDAVHVYVGGSMNLVNFSPRDPAFYLHHANIDRLWFQWQNLNPIEPAADVRNTLATIHFGSNDTKAYDSLHNPLQVSTARGSGYRYI